MAASVDREVRLSNVLPFREIVNRTLIVERLIAQVSTAFSLVALLIAAVGLYTASSPTGWRGGGAKSGCASRSAPNREPSKACS
jgi:hypothetical protein